MEEENRKCKQCGRTFPLTAEYFYRDKGCKGGFRRVCKDCKEGRSGIEKRKAKEGYKICSVCEEEKPLTIEFWSKNKYCNDGFHTICKSCKNKTDKIVLPVDESDGFRICSKCGIRKPLNDDYFRKTKQNKSGYSAQCVACLNKYNSLKRGTFKNGSQYCRTCFREFELNEENFPKDDYFESGFSDVCNNCHSVSEKIKFQKLKKGNKFCLYCGEQYPKTKEYFFKRGKGYDVACKKCRGYEFGIKQNVMNREKVEGHKYCTQCEKLLPLSEKYFYKSNGVEDGFTTVCKKCLKVKAKENIEHTRKYKRIAQQIRRSRKQKLPSTFTLEDWQNCKEHFNNECCYCGDKTENLQQDHFIPVSKKGHYTKYNIVPACQKCNISKKDKNFKEWYSEQEFYSEERKNKIIKYLKSNF